MRISTLAGYLIGNREAIREIAADRSAVWTGLLFVLSAGLARDYDGEDLVHEPWRLLIPVLVSLWASFVLFYILWDALQSKWPKGDGPVVSYRSFLGLFWMTAPLAWLYAVPYERFLGPLDAMRVNLITLAVVSVWRVALITRVAVVLMGFGALAATFRVAVAASGLAVVGMCLNPSPVPMFVLMGGVRLPPEIWLRGQVKGLVICWGTFLFLGLIPLALVTGRTGAVVRPPPLPEVPEGKRSRQGRWLAWAALLVWVFILPYTQSEQILRTKVERTFQQGNNTDALAMMSMHQLSDFPPQWQAPPRFDDELLDVMQVIANNDPAPWVRALYVERFRKYLGEEGGFLSRRFDKDLRRISALLERLPEGRTLAAEHLEKAKMMLRKGEQDPEKLEAARTILRLSQQE